MAVYTATKNDSMPIPVQPAVISVYVPNSASEINIPFYVPWRDCRLAYVTSTVVTVIDNTGAMEVDIELNAASGTEMMTLTIAQNAAVGTQTEATVSTQAACENLSRSDTSRDVINIEVDGSSSASGAAMLFFYFESM